MRILIGWLLHRFSLFIRRCQARLHGFPVTQLHYDEGKVFYRMEVERQQEIHKAFCPPKDDPFKLGPVIKPARNPKPYRNQPEGYW